jgi:CheY-like chemotaxis protein
MLMPWTTANERVRILIVDDHEDSRIITRLVLEQAGFQVSEASTGPEGLRIALAERPRLVLVDIMLPEMDGFELSRRLRANPATHETRLVALTARADRRTREESMLAGCDAFLAKPVHIAALRTTILEELNAAPRNAPSASAALASREPNVKERSAYRDR